MIPTCDLAAQYHSIQAEVDAAIREVLESGNFTLGPNVLEFERELARFCGCEYGIGVASGTDALRLAMDALDIGPGDEVITTPFTFVSTAAEVTRAGGTPIFVDIEPRTMNIDPAQVERAVTPRTRALLPVHLFGNPADMAPLMELAARCGLPVVEDAAQAMGAAYQGRLICSFGLLSCVSFFPTKLLGAYGDAGMILTRDRAMAERLDVLRRFGGSTRYLHERLGYNSRLDELQAAVLRVKLRRLGEWNARRRQIAAGYDRLLAGLPLRLPSEAPGAFHVYQEYTVRTHQREALQAFLLDRGVETAVYYPLPLHLQQLYLDLGLGPGSFPEAERAAAEVLSLPIYPELTDEQVEEVAAAVRAFHGG
jgi:dTDP-4-amino-4,6-dideoxygalactose transaminase